MTTSRMKTGVELTPIFTVNVINWELYRSSGKCENLDIWHFLLSLGWVSDFVWFLVFFIALGWHSLSIGKCE
jgi:hypothetical protein